MIYLFMPIGSGTGWGTCGKYLCLEMAKLGPSAIVTGSQITPESVGDELEWGALLGIPKSVVNADTVNLSQTYFLEGVAIRMLNDFELNLWLENIQSEKTIGYTFYCGSPLTQKHLDAAGELDLIVAGSSFCEKQLNRAGLKKTKTIIQGVNPQIFNPANATKSLFKDRFVVFSGGKLEYRKGNDIVMRAFKIFSEKHSDAILVNSWFNIWEFSLNTMAASSLIEFVFDHKNYMQSMVNLYKMNGLSPEKIITLPIKPSFQMAHVYKNTDIGLFPNRCEGGTNLMLMEYMACGKPAIASAQTGHADIITPINAFPIETYTPVKNKNGNLLEYQGWIEPDIDEVVYLLERAYENKEACQQKGKAAGKFMEKLSWEKAAKEFYNTALEFT